MEDDLWLKDALRKAREQYTLFGATVELTVRQSSREEYMAAKQSHQESQQTQKYNQNDALSMP